MLNRVSSSGAAGTSATDTADTANTRSAKQLPRPPSPLTSRKLAAMPGFSISEDEYPNDSVAMCRDIRVGPLSFIHCNKAKKSEKIDFINQVADRINAMPSDRPVTVVSLGSSALLVEELIFKQLSNEHQKQIQFRLIDTVYTQGEPGFAAMQDARNTFKQGKKSKPFTTSSAYLSKEVNGKRLADSDQEDGPVFVLSVNPPTILDERKIDPELLSEGLVVQGFIIPIEFSHKANAVVLDFNIRNGENKLSDCVSAASRELVFCSKSVALCHIDKKQRLVFKTPLCNMKNFLVAEAQRVIASSMRAHTASDQNPMSTLYEAAMNCVDHFHHPDHWTQQKFELNASLISEYGRSVDELKDYFSYSQNHAVFASLYKNKIEFKELNISARQRAIESLQNLLGMN
jgi:hypothetical protein